MQDTIAKYKIISKEDPETSDSWSPVAKEGGTRIYRKEEERENVMVDYLVAITQINVSTSQYSPNQSHYNSTQLFNIAWRA